MKKRLFLAILAVIGISVTIVAGTALVAQAGGGSSYTVLTNKWAYEDNKYGLSSEVGIVTNQYQSVKRTVIFEDGSTDESSGNYAPGMWDKEIYWHNGPHGAPMGFYLLVSGEFYPAGMDWISLNPACRVGLEARMQRNQLGQYKLLLLVDRGDLVKVESGSNIYTLQNGLWWESDFLSVGAVRVRVGEASALCGLATWGDNNTPMLTSTATSTSTATNTPTSTSTSTATNTPTSTPTLTPTSTSTNTATPLPKRLMPVIMAAKQLPSGFLIGGKNLRVKGVPEDQMYLDFEANDGAWMAIHRKANILVLSWTDNLIRLAPSAGIFPSGKVRAHVGAAVSDWFKY